jgi:hypothetical protein
VAHQRAPRARPLMMAWPPEEPSSRSRQARLGDFTESLARWPPEALSLRHATRVLFGSVGRSHAHHVGDARDDKRWQMPCQQARMERISPFVLREQGQQSRSQSNPKGCLIGERRPRRRARRAEVIPRAHRHVMDGRFAGEDHLLSG